LLPKNPHFADHLIRLALQRKYGNDLHIALPGKDHQNGHVQAEMIPVASYELSASASTSTTPTAQAAPISLATLDDRLEWEAHATILERLGLYNDATMVIKGSNHEF
jgi:hypothetical protein